MSLWKQGRGRRRSKVPRVPPETWNIYTSVLNGNHKMNNRKLNSFESVLMRWMKLEPIIQSEVSQKDKDHYNILTHIYGI